VNERGGPAGSRLSPGDALHLDFGILNTHENRVIAFPDFAKRLARSGSPSWASELGGEDLRVRVVPGSLFEPGNRAFYRVRQYQNRRPLPSLSMGRGSWPRRPVPGLPPLGRRHGGAICRPCRRACADLQRQPGRPPWRGDPDHRAHQRRRPSHHHDDRGGARLARALDPDVFGLHGRAQKIPSRSSCGRATMVFPQQAQY